MKSHLPRTILAAALVALPLVAQQGNPPPNAGQPAGADDQLVTLNVRQIPLGQVLEMISVQRHVNIVAGVDTNVPVTANFYDASLEQALDWVLAPLGFAWVHDGKVYEVIPAAEYELIQRPLVHHIFRPNYLAVSELERFLTQMLSPQGRIVKSEDAKAGISSGGDDAGGNSSTMPETLVVIDNQESVDRMKSMFADLDQRPRQVLVEATILEVKLDETNRFGVDFNFVDAGFGEFESLSAPQNTYSAPGNLLDGALGPGAAAAGAPFLTPSGTVSGSQGGFTENDGNGLRLGYVGSNIAVFLEALQTVADTNVLANTKVLALNKQKGEIIIGGRLGYFGGTTVSDGISQQTVEFLEVGTQLRFRPYIGNDGFVRLEIHPQRSSGIVDPTTGLPTEATSEVTSNIMVRDGETVVIGGLIETRDVNQTRRVPVLGYLPGIGWLFSSEETQVERSEIIVMITPHILENGAQFEDGKPLIDENEATRERMRRNYGPVARIEQATRNFADARESLEKGDLDAARSACDRGLLIDPMHEGAIELSREIDARLAEAAVQGGATSMADD